MKLLFLLVLFTHYCVCHLSFEEWKVEYKRSYNSLREEKERRLIFYENVIQISMLNQLHPEVEFKINQFADISIEEFKNRVLMPSRPPSDHDTPLYQPSTPSEAPEEWDWRDQNVVTPVKDQGTVGTCWAFGTTGNLEGQWAIKTRQLVSLSEEQLVDCDASKNISQRQADCGVFGGWPYLALGYVKRAGGIQSDDSYPYCSGSGSCFPCVPNGYNVSLCGREPEFCNETQSCAVKLKPDKFVPGLKVSGIRIIPRDETVMKDSLASLGPLSVLIDATFLQFYHSGVWETHFCGAETLDHAVLLVGYGIHKGVFEEKPYWLVKNSWGQKWGQKGYFMILRGQNMCGVAEEVVSAVLE